LENKERKDNFIKEFEIWRKMVDLFRKKYFYLKEDDVDPI
jgi:hypothetical protein